MAEAPERSFNKYRGVALYDNFNFSGSLFGVALIAEIDPIQYYRDRPLFLGYKDPLFAHAINYNQNPMDSIDLPEVNIYMEKLKEVQAGTDIYNEEVKRLEEVIKQYSSIETGEDLGIEYPDMTPEPETIQIKDQAGNIIKTINIDLTERDTKPVQAEVNTEKAISILDKLGPEYADDQRPQEADLATIATLPDTYTKEKMWIGNELIPGFNKDVGQAGQDFRESMDGFITIAPQPEDLDKAQEYIKKLQEPIEMWYGIPLISLSARDIPVKDSYILHVNTKNNWTLDVTNILGTGLDKTLISIDKTIPAGKKFTAGLTLDNLTLSIYLQIEDDAFLYTNSITLEDTPEMQLSAYGADNEGLKTICGYIWDIKYWTTSDYNPERPGNPRPGNPGEGVFYPGDTGGGGGGDNTITPGRPYGGTLIAPEGNWNKPAYGGGTFLNLNDNYRMVFNSYMDRFFCRYNLQDTDFTIGWYQYQLGYGSGLKTLVSDNINSNYIRYDYDNFEIVIDFNNFHYRERILLPEFMWCQTTVRVNLTTNELVIGFRDFYWDRYEEIRVNIGSGLDFELMSLWGRFSQDEGSYLEVQKGVFGLVFINTEYFSDDKLKEVYDEHKLFLEQFNPREMELPEGV